MSGQNSTPGSGQNTPSNSGSNAVADRNAADVQRLTRSAKDYLAEGKYGEADTAYGAVLKVDPKNQEAADAIAKSNKFRDLRDKGAAASRSKNAAAAQQALAAA